MRPNFIYFSSFADQALKINPNYPIAHVLKAATLMMWRKFDQVEPELKKAFEVNPNHGGDFDGDVFQLMPVTRHKPLEEIGKPNRDWSDLVPLAIWGVINSLLKMIGLKGPKWLASPDWAMPAKSRASTAGDWSRQLSYRRSNWLSSTIVAGPEELSRWLFI